MHTSGIDSANTSAPLLSANVCDDMFHLLRGDVRLRWHLTKFPVMRPHPVLDSHMKGEVCVMGRAVHRMHQRWPLRATLAAGSVTKGAIPVEQSIALGRIALRIGVWQVHALEPLIRGSAIARRQAEEQNDPNNESLFRDRAVYGITPDSIVDQAIDFRL